MGKGVLNDHGLKYHTMNAKEFNGSYSKRWTGQFQDAEDFPRVSWVLGWGWEWCSMMEYVGLEFVEQPAKDRLKSTLPVFYCTYMSYSCEGICL